MTRGLKTVSAPKPAPVKPKRVKKAKPELRVIQHRSLGACVVVGVFLTDAGRIVVDCDFNGVTRTLALDASYWVSDTAELLAAMPPQSRKPETKTVRKPEPADDEEAEGERELEPDDAGHLGEREVADSEEGLETEDSESAEVEEVLA